MTAQELGGGLTQVAAKLREALEANRKVDELLGRSPASYSKRRRTLARAQESG